MQSFVLLWALILEYKDKYYLIPCIKKLIGMISKKDGIISSPYLKKKQVLQTRI